MENQEKLDKPIGTKETEVLKPKKVKILQIGLVSVKVGTADKEKVAITVKHPDREEPIIISKAKTLKKDKVTISGLWFTEDEDGNIVKNSTFAEFLRFAGVNTAKQLIGKEFDTVTDEDGYLVIKSY